jgi:hypothetical protein
MWKGVPQVGDIFYDFEGDKLLVVEINGEAERGEQVRLLHLDTDEVDSYYTDSLDNFKSGAYLAKIG